MVPHFPEACLQLFSCLNTSCSHTRSQRFPGEWVTYPLYWIYQKICFPYPSRWVTYPVIYYCYESHKNCCISFCCSLARPRLVDCAVLASSQLGHFWQEYFLLILKTCKYMGLSLHTTFWEHSVRFKPNSQGIDSALVNPTWNIWKPVWDQRILNLGFGSVFQTVWVHLYPTQSHAANNSFNNGKWPKIT